MSDRKSAKRISPWVKQLGKWPQDTMKGMVTRLLRLAFMMNRRSRFMATGFVLPTVVLLILVVTLTTGALVFRAYNSSTNTIANGQNRVIYNAATPAIDRARAKLEYLFDASKDSRLPSGVPSEQYLTSMMLNDASTIKGATAPALLKGGSDPVTNDPYRLPDEARIDINGDSRRDNAWSYTADTDGDGAPDATVAYSILFSTPLDETSPPSGQQPIKGTQKLVSLSDAAKVAGESALPGERRISYARSGPISNAAGLSCGTGGGSRDGWYADRASSSTLRKNFQIDAVVIPHQGAGGVTTLELQQDRQLDSGNKWGAWFRNDLELNPGATFQWNGAMHSEGSFLVGNGGNFTAHLISSPNSCLFEPTASQISVTVRPPVAGATDPEEARGFRGLVMAGSVANDNIDGNSPIYIHSSNPQSVNLTPNTDWVNNTARPYQVILQPNIVQTRNQNKAAAGTGDNRDQRQANLYDNPNTNFQGRFRQQTEPSPYVDDTYRADNRYGPKPRYDNQITIPATNNAGDLIPLGAAFNGGKTGLDLIRTEPPTGSTTSDNVGLDGYWERRARIEGLRILVGERLELGNPFGWGGSPATPPAAGPDYSINTDPLYPPVHPTATPGANTTTTLRHEIQQNRALRDNLAAVQATAIYHAGVGTDRDQPAACLISTAHPGTPQTLANAIDFRNLATPTATTPYIDFFNGRGTNGWEFAPPSQTAVTTGTMRTALLNLAQFAGDHISDARTGAFPPTQEANTPHPYPMFTMWGNFSNLRRTLASGTAYTDLSPADRSYLYTAACTVGALAYSTNQISNFDFSANRTALEAVATRLEEIIRKSATPSDYINAPVERLFAELEDPTRVVLATGQVPPTPPTAAQRIDIEIAKRFAARAQILRDRAFGFRPSPTVPVTVGGVTLQVADLAATAVPGDPYSTDRTFLDSLTTLNPAQRAALRKLYGNYVPANSVTGAPAGIQPEYPALYYIFPSTAHGQTGPIAPTFPTAVQPASEPYIADAYVTTANPSTITYAVVNPSDVDVALAPRPLDDWVLPYTTTIATDDRYRNTNFIRVPSSGNANGVRVAVGFLDRVIYNGRERLPARVMDLDLGLLRRTSPRGVTTDAWLPKSGVVYAFREDALREDAIARPAGASPNNTNTQALTLRALNATNPFADQTDPPLAAQRLSIKAVDYVADPARRVHGFRLRDGSRLSRQTGTTTTENTRGLSLFTDNPTYIMGDLNLHEETGTTNPLEEFLDRLWNYTATDTPYTAATFYARSRVDTRFAAAATDEWRPTEILADAITILSDSFCDGSVLDGFWIPGQQNDARLSTTMGFYNSTTTGLYGRGCATDRTSFLNQNRPRFDTAADPTGATANWGPLLPPTTNNRTWLRENPYDPTSPVRISRNGLPLIVAVGSNASALTSGSRSQAGIVPTAHTDATTGYYNITTGGVEERPLQLADTINNVGQRVNAITISGQVPQRQGQGNGGLHNFPRFLENWGGRRLWFSGSLLQLNFSNYADGNFDSDTWEPGDTPIGGNGGERISYYSPPNRFWGYDVALQLAPSSPAAARFVTPSANRSEFYSELPVSDAYIKALCTNAPTPTGVRKPC